MACTNNCAENCSEAIIFFRKNMKIIAPSGTSVFSLDLNWYFMTYQESHFIGSYAVQGEYKCSKLNWSRLSRGSLLYIPYSLLLIVYVCTGVRLNNAWPWGTFLGTFLQPESLLSSQDLGLKVQVQAPGFELMTPLLGFESCGNLAISHSHYLVLFTTAIVGQIMSFLQDALIYVHKWLKLKLMCKFGETAVASNVTKVKFHNFTLNVKIKASNFVCTL